MPRGALPIWAELMQAIPQHISGNWFQMPPGVVRKRICSETGAFAFRRGCKPMEEFFLEDPVSSNESSWHQQKSPLNRVVEEFKDVIQSF